MAMKKIMANVRPIPCQRIYKKTLFRYFPQCIIVVVGRVQRLPKPKVDKENF